MCKQRLPFLRLHRYNYPGVTNQVVVAPESYTELAQHPNIVGCKM